MAKLDFKSAAARLSFQTGISDEGKVMKKTKTYQNIAKDVTADDLYSGLTALASLSSYSFIEMERIDTASVKNN